MVVKPSTAAAARNRWQGLRERYAPPTREARDTLFMLAVIAWTVAPHLLRLSPWVTALCGVVLLWRAALALRQEPLPSRWTVGIVLVIAALLTWWTERTLIGKEAGITLLVVTMALKTLELRARRDALVVFFLGFFLVLTQFLYSQSVWTAFAMGLSVWGWLTALTLAHMPAGRPRLMDAGALAGRAALYGAPLMALLFMLFPRIDPLWATPGQTLAHTGLSDHLRLGDIAELANDDSIAFRIRFAGPAPRTEQLYFRGPVLTRYDGLRWNAEAHARIPAPRTLQSAYDPIALDLIGEPINYQMTIEPLRLAWLPLLEMTPLRPRLETPLEGLPQFPDAHGQWRTRLPLTERLRLSAQAWTDYRADIELAPDVQQAQTQLPPGRHPRTVAWAAEMRRDARYYDADADTLAAALLRHIATNNYSYTLSPGVSLDDPVDDFWFDRRAGFCEHYASAFVVVMRALGVPARIVTGYQGSDPVPADGYLVVRQSHAHAWAEYWQPGRGWVRSDPTAAVAPDRIERGQPMRPAPSLVMGAFEAMNPDLRLRLRSWLELVDNRWNQWVLNYGRTQQFEAMRKLGFETPDWVDLGRITIALVVLLGLAGAAWAFLDARRRTPWQRAQARLIRSLRGLGIAAGLHESPRTLAQHVRRRWGKAGEPLAAGLLRLERLRYGRQADEAALARWGRLFDRYAQRLRRPG